MRNTVFCLSEDADTGDIEHSIEQMVQDVTSYVLVIASSSVCSSNAPGRLPIPCEFPGWGYLTALRRQSFLKSKARDIIFRNMRAISIS